MADSDLKFSQIQSAFFTIADKHNALVDLVKGMEGTNGVTIKTSDAKILVSVSASSPENAAAEVVGSDGKLNKVTKHSTWTTPTTFPTALKVVNSSTSVLIDSTGVTITTSASKTCTIAFSAITQNMTVREIDICDSGTNKKMLVIGSAPYT
jgi:hypothetical protein